ncbi:phosphatase PAP2 family protein [Paraburkholderia sp. DHOC27]|nr:phosphatase PAP2 family protein [Paraburkholderia sp. DHOC27]
MRLLSYLTNFGDPFLTVPLAGAVMLWLAATRSWRALITWVVCFSAGAGLVAASHFAYAAWGLEVPALNMTAVSGHTMLASAVYPTTFALCASMARTRTAVYAYVFGLVFALAIGLSRLLMGFHTPAEVVTGWLLGTLIAAITCRPALSLRARAGVLSIGREARRDSTAFAALALALIVVCHGKILPVSAWIDDNASRLSQQWSKVPLDDSH